MTGVGTNIRLRARRATALLSALLLAASLGCAVPCGWAYAAPVPDEGAQVAYGEPSESYVNVGFFVAVAKEGTDSYPQNEEELQQILTGVYSPGIYIDQAFDASDFAEFGGDAYGDELYDLTGEAINARILTFPTEEQIAEACARGGIEFNPETQTVVWYVVKSADSVWDTMWHIDGLLVPKEIAPGPDEPEEPGTDEPDAPDPDEPENPDDPDVPNPDPDPDDPNQPEDPDPDQPVDPDGPDTPVDPDEPDTPVDPDDPEVPVDPDEPDSDDQNPDTDPGDSEESSGSDDEGGAVEPEAPGNADLTDSDEPAVSKPSSTHESLPGNLNTNANIPSEAPGAGATPTVIESREGASQPQAKDSAEPVADAEAPAAPADASNAANSIAQDETPLGAAPAVPGEEPVPGGISEAASTALHAVGALGLAGVAAGVIAANVAAAQAGSALSSLDSQLRGRGRGRR